MTKKKELEKLKTKYAKLEKAFSVVIGKDLHQSSIDSTLYDTLSPWEKALLVIDFDMPESIPYATASASNLYSSIPNPPPSIWAKTDNFEENYSLLKKWWRSDAGYSLATRTKEILEYNSLCFEEKEKFRKNRDLIIKEQEIRKRKLLGQEIFFVTPENSDPSRGRGLSMDTNTEEESTSTSTACISFSNEGDDLVEQRMKEIDDEIERSKRQRGEEDRDNNQRGRVRQESEKGFGRGAFSSASVENVTPIRNTKQRLPTHLATSDIRKKFQRLTMLLIELLNLTDPANSQDGSLYNDFMLINCRNVHFTKNKPGKQQMNHLGHTEVTVIGRNKDALLKSVHLLGCAVLNESTSENQVSPIYIANTEAKSLDDVANEYFEKIETTSREFEI